MAQPQSDEFPDDATGGALRLLQQDGADLTKPHYIDFAVAVPTEEAGHEVAQYAREHGFEIDLVQEEQDVEVEDEETLEWTCYCSKLMVPTHQAITAVEDELDAVARTVGGHADGWGALPVE